MTFTIFSLAITVIIATFVLTGVIKGIKKGFIKMLMLLSTFLIAIFLGVIISRAVSDPITDFVINLLADSGVFEELEQYIAHIRLVMYVIIDAFITPILFIAIFFTLKGILQIILAIISKILLKEPPFDMENRSSKETWYVKNSKPLGALVGAICGILTAIVIISPIYGTVRTAGQLVEIVYGENALLPKDYFGDVSEELDAFKKYSNDIPCTALDVVGGKLLYQSLSYSKCEYEGDYFDSKGNIHTEKIKLEIYVSKECETLSLILKDSTGMSEVAETGGLLNKDNIEILRSLVNDVEHSDLLELLMSDMISGAARSWRSNGTYLSSEKPDLGSSGNYLFDVVLFVLENTNYEVVVSDMNTMFNALEIMVESNLMDEEDYSALLSNYEENDTFERLCAEFEKNPRTAMIPEQVTAMTVNIAAQAFTELLDDEQYDKVTINLASQWNDISAVSDKQTKVTVLTQKTKEAALDYDVDIPDSVAQATAEAIVAQFDGRSQITSKDMDNFIKQYKEFNFAE